jgi:hypothetical protein
VPTLSFLHFHVPTNATSITTGLTSLNDVTIAHVSATTATTTATKTQVTTTRTATTNAPKYHLDKCKATRTHHKTRSPSILHPAKIAANYATQNLLLYAQIGSAITAATHAQNLLLFFVQNNPAITMANHANSKLQLIVECLFLLRNEDNSELQLIDETPILLLLRDFKRPAITAVMNGSFSFKFIVESILEGARFAPNFDQPSNLDSSRLIVDFISTTLKDGAIAPTHQLNLHVEFD